MNPSIVLGWWIIQCSFSHSAVAWGTRGSCCCVFMVGSWLTLTIPCSFIVPPRTFYHWIDLFDIYYDIQDEAPVLTRWPRWKWSSKRFAVCLITVFDVWSFILGVTAWIRRKSHFLLRSLCIVKGHEGRSIVLQYSRLCYWANGTIILVQTFVSNMLFDSWSQRKNWPHLEYVEWLK